MQDCFVAMAGALLVNKQLGISNVQGVVCQYFENDVDTSAPELSATLVCHLLHSFDPPLHEGTAYTYTDAQGHGWTCRHAHRQKRGSTQLNEIMSECGPSVRTA